MCAFLFSPSPAHFVLLNLITVSLFILQFSQFSPVLSRNSLLTTLWSDTSNLCSSLRARDQVLHPCNTQHIISIVIRLGLDDRGLIPGEGRGFSLHDRFRTGSRAHPPSYAVGTGGFFPGGKAAEAWNWPLISILCWRSECLKLYVHSPYVFMVWWLIKAQILYVFRVCFNVHIR